MITHIVMIKLQEPTDDNINGVVEQVASMDGKIDELISIEVGRDVIRSPRSYDVGLIARFATLDDLNSYGTHPVHLPVLDFIRPLASSVVAVDFEVQSTILFEHRFAAVLERRLVRYLSVS